MEYLSFNSLSFNVFLPFKMFKINNPNNLGKNI